MHITTIIRNPKVIALYMISLFLNFFAQGQGFEGYYQSPAIYENTIVFAAEGDLWTVPLCGGLARRVTAHAGVGGFPTLSPRGV
jgi:tricorn protease